MALIKCGECGTEVSTLAAVCPKCAAPIANAPAAKAIGQGVTVTELTSKSLKKRRLVSVAMIIVGVLVFFGAETGSGTAAVGALLTFAGLMHYLVVSTNKWWHHG